MSSALGDEKTGNNKSFLINKLLIDSSSPNSLNRNELVVDMATASAYNNIDQDKEDLVSETGTYTIDEGEKVPGDEQKQSSSGENIEIVTARAAIDETFGIIQIKRPEIDSEPVSQASIAERSPKHRISRQRNKTYCLTKDFLTAEPIQADSLAINSGSNPTAANLSFSASSSSSISSYSNDSKLKKTTAQPTATTNNESPESGSNTAPTTSRTIRTDVLLGDTENLMEELKKKQVEKREKLNSKLKSLNNKANVGATNLTYSSSSNSSSSTNLSNEKPPLPGQSWTIPTSKEISHGEDGTGAGGGVCSASTRATVDFDMDKNDEDQVESSMMVNRNGGGLAFDIPSDQNNNRLQNNPNLVCLSPAALQRLSTAPRSSSAASFRSRNDSESCNESCSTNCYKDLSDRSSNVTLLRKYEMKRQERASHQNDDRSSVVTNMTTNSTRGSGVSLGTKIQQKAKSNNDESSKVSRRSSDININGTPAPYVNRTLQLRQQSAKAKRDSLEQRKSNDLNASVNSSCSSSRNSKTSVQNRSVSRTGTDKQPPPPRSSSRTTSPHSINPIMTTSLILTNGGGLGGDEFHRSVSNRTRANTAVTNRISSSRISSVERSNQDKETKTSGSRLVSSSSISSGLKSHATGLTRTQSLREKKTTTSSVTSRPATTTLTRKPSVTSSIQKATSNRPTATTPRPTNIPQDIAVVDTAQSSNSSFSYENILQSTLQRLCIRLIQMSTGVLDKIGGSGQLSHDSMPLINSGSELERMQQLAKLVHSMQLVHDHLQVIDSTLSTSQITDENYIRELTKIRQDVDLLKQTAALTSPRVSK